MSEVSSDIYEKIIYVFLLYVIPNKKKPLTNVSGFLFYV